MRSEERVTGELRDPAGVEYAPNVAAGCRGAEAGVIPKEWKSCNVRAIASPSPNAIVGGPFGSNLVSQDYVAHGIPVIRGQNMGGRWVSGDFVFVSPAKAKTLEANQAHPGDVVFTQRGTLGQVSLVPESPFRAYVVSQSQMKLSVNPSIADSLFVFYYFTSREQQKLIQGNAIQTGIPHINLGILRGLPVQLPRLAQQRAIAAVLSDVDEQIGSLEALIAKKRDIKQAVMQQLLTGKTRLPGFGGEWETGRLGNLGTFCKGKGIRRDELGETGARCVRYGELYTRYENYVAKPVSRIPQHVADSALQIKAGDLLFAGSGETAEEIGICVAYIGEEPVYVGGDIIVLRASGQDAVYLAHLLNSPVAARQKSRMAQGDAVVHLRGDHLAEVELPLPPLPEQRAIAAVLSDMDTEIAALERRLDKTRAIKQGMMQQLLTGRTRLIDPHGSSHGEAAQ